jgi:hypothetical protein
MLFLKDADMSDSMIAPQARRIVEKLAASIALAPNASLQRTEFIANATSASNVQINVFIFQVKEKISNVVTGV